MTEPAPKLREKALPVVGSLVLIAVIVSGAILGLRDPVFVDDELLLEPDSGKIYRFTLASERLVSARIVLSEGEIEIYFEPDPPSPVPPTDVLRLAGAQSGSHDRTLSAGPHFLSLFNPSATKRAHLRCKLLGLGSTNQ
jgi:hypothetical protein